jgi:NAD(P)H dehydrogenase (quinone)
MSTVFEEGARMIAVTGATGQLGRLVIESLLGKVSAEKVVAAVRDPAKAEALVKRGVQTRRCDYDRADTLRPAFEGVEKLVMISASEIGKRVEQHRAVIAAAKQAGVGLVAYTSILRAGSSPIGLAKEHSATEAALRESGVPFVALRNGWYTENYTMGIPAALQYGVLLGCADDGRISSAARQDYADAAVAVVTSEGHAGRVYELAGDTSFTMSELAEELSRRSGKTVAYNDLSEDEYRAALINAGLPEPVAAMLADADSAIAKGALFDEDRALSRLIGRPTTPWAETIAAAIAR